MYSGMLCVSVSELELVTELSDLELVTELFVLELVTELSVDGHGDSALDPWEDSSSLLSTPLLLVEVELR
jgi:hypothetical protein